MNFFFFLYFWNRYLYKIIVEFVVRIVFFLLIIIFLEFWVWVLFWLFFILRILFDKVFRVLIKVFIFLFIFLLIFIFSFLKVWFFKFLDFIVLLLMFFFFVFLMIYFKILLIIVFDFVKIELKFLFWIFLFIWVGSCWIYFKFIFFENLVLLSNFVLFFLWYVFLINRVISGFILGDLYEFGFLNWWIEVICFIVLFNEYINLNFRWLLIFFEIRNFLKEFFLELLNFFWILNLIIFLVYRFYLRLLNFNIYLGDLFEK